MSRTRLIWLFRMPEILASLGLMLFLFSYFFALNANMDYVQRFMSSGGDLRLASDTSRERLVALIRYVPLILINFTALITIRIGKKKWIKILWGLECLRCTWAYPLVLLSALLTAFSFPSFVCLEGLPLLAFFALIPLFCVLRSVSYWWAVFYGVCYGVFSNLLINYWLGPYSLVSLQLTIVIFFLLYLLFMLPAVWLYKHIRRGRFLVLPMAWVLFDFLRSGGFLGYPWGLIGTTQYDFLPFIQIASVTGVWGVGFVVLLINSAFSELLSYLRHDRRNISLTPLYVSLGLFMACLFLGSLELVLDASDSGPRARFVRVALIQQNSDPRKHAYEETFATLRELTDRTLPCNPDLVAWSETAFVPNIRRWSREDPEKYELAALAKDFMAYQESTGRWLLTGNDDYSFFEDESGREIRFDYNASVLFSPNGTRQATYHKIHLVPFTENFPYQEELPWFYEVLLRFDVHLWEPGTERVVFRHPLFTFCTPICFEDTFPNDVRKFILEGAEVILNISNDYWSLTEVEAKQHFIASLFRAVENRVPLLRATASGITCYVDSTGRLKSSLPYFQEDFLVADVELPEARITVYSCFGDWLPLLMIPGLVLLIIINLPRLRRSAASG